MKQNYIKRLIVSVFLWSTLMTTMQFIYAQPRMMENLDRGVVAVKTISGVYVSWRLLGSEDKNMQFNVYRDGSLVDGSPVSGATNLTDAAGTTTSTYTVESVLNGEVKNISEAVSTWGQQYLTIGLNRPASGVTPPNSVGSVGKTGTLYPDGQSYSYTPNDCSVGDLDGDGEYEIVVKWNPSNAQDNSYYGITGNVYLDAYKMDGTQLWRIDLGRNIRAGAHYTQFMVYDFDSDGKAEVVCKTAPGTIDGKNNNVLMGTDVATADYRNLDPTQTSGSKMVGTILTGSEYLTLFDGETGGALHTIAYKPLRGSVSGWGDAYGNRVDRFLGCVAYLDGIHPSVVMCRGYYARTTLCAFDVVNKQLVERWFHDSSTSGVGAFGQGNHNLSVADVDSDGKDEIICGACAIDHDGTVKYRTGLGHGDAMHVSDLNPDRAGLEVFVVHEDKSAAYGYDMHDAATGTILWGRKTGSDVGRGMSGDIDGTSRGFESWCNDTIYSCTGTILGTKKPASVNFRIYWDGDLQDELLDYTRVDKWNPSTQTSTNLITFGNITGAKEINSTKANPCLSADLIGDWREEVIYYDKNDPSKLLLFTTVIPTNYRLYTLMHDPVYRLAIAWQNTSYNQPPHLGFYIGDGVDNVTWPNISPVVISAVKLNEKGNCTIYTPSENCIKVSADDEIVSVEVYAINGTLISAQHQIHSTEYGVTIPQSHGLCIVKVTTITGTTVQKVIVE